MGYVIFGLKETRITLYQDDGVTPRYRVTLQKEVREGLDLTFKPEGVSHQLGSGAAWAKRWIHRGFRPTLAIKWKHGMESTLEAWGTGSWNAATVITTAQALGFIHTYASRVPCLVSPHKDMNFDFLAQPDPGKSFNLQDLKGVLHTDLALNLIATRILQDVPDFTILNDYFTAGYTDTGYGAFTP